jgi:hypothetical protein
MNIAYHFTGDKLRDGSPFPPIGQTIVFPGKIEICRAGYHWSERPSHALAYAPGPMLHMVRYGGEVQRQDDKGCSSERTILATVDATCLLRRFAADQALSVAHLWDMPQVVCDYLTTLDETLRDAAWDAAWAAAWNAAWNAARAAAWEDFDRRVYSAFEQA